MEHIIAKLLQDFERGKMTRRQLIKSLALTATAASAVSVAPAAAADSKVFKAVYLNHVSYQVADYAKTRDFYAGLLGMSVSRDDGKQCRLSFGDNILIARNRPSGSTTSRVDHIAYTIAGWDTDKSVKDALGAELKRRGLEVRDTPGSLHVNDPDGFEVQMGGKEE
jgi:catechol 2,3-dioxygenase-like lactoylglutathione lyase family enzyme